MAKFFWAERKKGAHKETANNVIVSLPAIPIEHLIALVALGALALAAWAIHAVSSIARTKEDE